MKFDSVEKFIEIAKNSGVSELEYEEKDFKLSVKLPVSGQTFVQPIQSQAIANAPKADVDAAQSGLLEISCPFVGTFYRASSPDAAPYAKVGDRVSPGQVLCIVEAMKIMNEIESEISGEIVEICVENETYVEFGQPLFRIKP